MNRYFYINLVLSALLCVFLCSCTNKEPAPSPQEDVSGIIARVGDTTITEADLALLAGKTLGIKDSADIDSQARIKLIDSLVKSRAIAIQAERSLLQAEMTEIDNKVAAYREELLVNKYLRMHADLNPMTNEMIKEYYVQHLDEFGGKKIRAFEYVKSGPDPDEDTRDRIISEMARLRKVKDWNKEEKRLNGAGLFYHKARLSVDLLEKPLRGLVENTAVNNVSEVFAGREIVMVRVLEETELPARPLDEVSAVIRRKLAPVVMKQVIAQASSDALEQTSVTYMQEKDIPEVQK